MNNEVLRLDNQLCFRLYKASRRMTRLYKPILKTLNLTYPQYLTMLVMWETKKIDFKELGQRLDLKTGTLTPIIKRLEKMGYLMREQNSDDNRRIWVIISHEGQKLKQDALKIPEFLLHYIKMDQEQYQRYISLLDELGDILEKAEINQNKKV